MNCYNKSYIYFPLDICMLCVPIYSSCKQTGLCLNCQKLFAVAYLKQAALFWERLQPKNNSIYCKVYGKAVQFTQHDLYSICTNCHRKCATKNIQINIWVNLIFDISEYFLHILYALSKRSSLQFLWLLKRYVNFRNEYRAEKGKNSYKSWSLMQEYSCI